MDRHEFANREPVVGDLRVEEVRDQSLGRYVRMARVVDVRRPRDPDLLPAEFRELILEMLSGDA